MINAAFLPTRLENDDADGDGGYADIDDDDNPSPKPRRIIMVSLNEKYRALAPIIYDRFYAGLYTQQAQRGTVQVQVIAPIPAINKIIVGDAPQPLSVSLKKKTLSPSFI